MASSSGTPFGNTKTVHPKGTHKATIVWLHDLGQTGLESTRFVRKLNLPNIKWICPTAPTRPVTSLGGIRTTAWFDMAEISENMQDDLGSLYSVTSFVANLLSSEPEHVMKGVGGIGLGAAEALYFASCYAFGWVPNDLQVVVGLNGWLPGWISLQSNIDSTSGAANRAASLPILVTHGISDDIVPYPFGHKCAESLRMAGFPIMFSPNEGDHKIAQQVINEVRFGLTTYLQLQD